MASCVRVSWSFPRKQVADLVVLNTEYIPPKVPATEVGQTYNHYAHGVRKSNPKSAESRAVFVKLLAEWSVTEPCDRVHHHPNRCLPTAHRPY